MTRSGRSGFTLIELMLVVAIIGLLAAIAIPKFANLVVKAKEASVKGKLGSLRSALTIYYSDNEGNFPGADFLASLTIGSKYLDAIPTIGIPTAPDHPPSNGVHQNTPGEWVGNRAWLYLGFNGTGSLNVFCTHTDSNGTTWSLW